jgi:hypothetical protein
MRHASESFTYFVKIDMVYHIGEMRFCGNLLRNKLRIFVELNIHITRYSYFYNYGTFTSNATQTRHTVCRHVC